MKTGRDDYNALIHHARIPADEPTFLLRAQDETTERTIHFWARESREAGVDEALIELSLQQADAVHAWPVKKLPDTDHLTEARRLHLRWLFKRRQWNARIEFTDTRVDELFQAILTLPESAQRELQGRLREHLSNTPSLARIWAAMETIP